MFLSTKWLWKPVRQHGFDSCSPVPSCDFLLLKQVLLRRLAEQQHDLFVSVESRRSISQLSEHLGRRDYFEPGVSILHTSGDHGLGVAIEVHREFARLLVLDDERCVLVIAKALVFVYRY